MSTLLVASVVVGVHMASIHAPAHDGQNNTNPGLYFRSDSGVTAGFYRNTHRRTSVYLGRNFKFGPLDVGVGVVSGYQKHCTDYMVKTGSYTTVEKVPGGTITSTYPVFETRQTCSGFSRGYFTPMVAPSYRLPFSVLGASPRIFFMPAKKSVLHLSIEGSF
jgi:hypothetical protein